MDKITTLAKHHKEWLSVVRTFGDEFLAEDIVQETYLRILRLNHIDKIVTDDINRGHMWLTLRSVYIDHIRKQKMDRLDLNDVYHLSYDEPVIAKHESLEKIYDRIEWEIKGWNWYDQKLWKIYKDERKPMRQIADETGISLKSIFLTIKSCKEKIRQSVGEDYTDFLNEEFELI